MGLIQSNPNCLKKENKLKLDTESNKKQPNEINEEKYLSFEEDSWIDISNKQMNLKEQNEIFSHIRKNSQVEHLNISNINISYSMIKEICNLIISSNSLKTLIMNNTNPTILSLTLLLEVISKNNSIKRLYLSSNSINAAGVELISQMLIVNNNIDYVNLSNNKFSLEGYVLIGDLLMKNKTLLEIDLSNNKIEYEKASFLVNSCVNSKIYTIFKGKKESLCEIKDFLMNNRIYDINLYTDEGILYYSYEKSMNNNSNNISNKYNYLVFHNENYENNDVINKNKSKITRKILI